MAILTKKEILKRIEDGQIRIEPFDSERVGPASIDLTISNTFRVFKNTHDLIHLTENPDINSVSEVITVTEYITLTSGKTIQGITREKITLPPSLCGWIQGRSRFARLGLMVHITASFIQPGTSNQQVLELSNAGPMPLAIHPGIAICQVILEEAVGEAAYHGKFQGQNLP